MNMFMLLEGILYILIILFDSSLVKFIAIIFCLLYTLYHQKGYAVLIVIVLADYFLLWSDQYIFGIGLFMTVQCFYHHMLKGHQLFYLLLITLLSGNLYGVAIGYALMSLWNLMIAYQQRHWLFVTIVLLALCDLCVMLQFVLNINIPMIWWFYLPSQLWYVKMVLSNEERTIVKEY